jgi:hypothetical protein
MSLTDEDKKKLRGIQAEDNPTLKDFDSAGDFLLPEGHYLVQVEDVRLEDYNGEKYSCDKIVFDCVVVEPAKYAGKTVKFNSINLYAKGEREWARNKRLAFLVSAGLVRKGDSAAVAAFDWSTLEGAKFVQEIEHNHYEKRRDDGTTEKKVNSRGKGFSLGFKPATAWGTPAAMPVAGAAAGTAGGTSGAGANSAPNTQNAGAAKSATAATSAAAGAGKNYADGL